MQTALTHTHTHTFTLSFSFIHTCIVFSSVSVVMATSRSYSMKCQGIQANLHAHSYTVHSNTHELLPWCFSYMLGTTCQGKSPAKRGMNSLIGSWCLLTLYSHTAVTFASTQWFDIYCRKLATKRLLNVCKSERKGRMNKRRGFWIWHLTSASSAGNNNKEMKKRGQTQT